MIENIISVAIAIFGSALVSQWIVSRNMKPFKPLIGKAMSILQRFSSDKRMDNKFNKLTAEDVDKAAEGQKLIMGDLLNQFPEVKMVLEHFSPETVEWLEDNPMAALRLIQRYLPFIQQFMGLTKSKKVEEYNV